MRKIFFILFVFLLPLCCWAELQPRPKIGLVLSGGGAKAGAHIGVLQVLDEMKIPIDFVVGTSMGAVVGGLYASGYTGNEIEEILIGLDWEKILLNQIDRDFLYYRRKRDDDIFLIKELIGFKDGEIQLPRGVMQGHKLYQSFKQYVIGQEPVGSFDNLSIPFKAIATNLLSGEKVVLSSGDLAKAMYASMAVPGLFSPIEVDGDLLVDGGAASNLPVETAKEMGADILIVVDVSAPMLQKHEIDSFHKVLDQMTNIQVQGNVKKSLGQLSYQDILIKPDLQGLTTSDYEKLDDAIQPGRDAILNKREKLQRLSSHVRKTHQKPSDKIFLKEVHVDNHTSLCSEIYYNYLPKKPGFYTTEQIDDYISRLHGLELFEKIEYEFEDGRLYVTPFERQWAPTYLQGTLLLATDFDGNSAFKLGIGMTRTLLNKLAGEVRLFGSIGNSTGLLAEWYQPITTDLAWYINPKILYERKPFPFFVEDEELARYLSTTITGVFALGRNFREWGRAEIGYSRTDGSNRLKVGGPPFPESNFDEGFGYFRFELDTLDNYFFPHKGMAGHLQYSLYREGLGDDRNNDQMKTKLTLSHTWKKHTGIIGAQYDTTTSGISAFNAQFKLGGLFRLSGLAEDQIFGQQAALLTAIYYYRLKEISIIPNYPFPLYLGMSLETGNAWQEKRSLFKHSFRGAGSLFLGLDTILGPFYFGYGFAENGKRAAHLYMGRPF